MKPKHNEGFSLVEIMVAIALLGLLVVPTCTSLLMAIQINTRTDDMRQAQLAVSSAVETLMAEGIPKPGAQELEGIEEKDALEKLAFIETYYADYCADQEKRFQNVDVTVSLNKTENVEYEDWINAQGFCIRITSAAEGLESVSVDTYIPCESVRDNQTAGEGGS